MSPAKTVTGGVKRSKESVDFEGKELKNLRFHLHKVSQDHFLCAETPGAARAWVSTLHATQLVLKVHKEAVNSLTGNGSATLGTVATVVAAANSTALESCKEIQSAMQVSLRSSLGMITNKIPDGPLDDITIMKETLRVKDEELQNLARDLRARDSTINDISEKLTETAEAAEAATSAAYTLDILGECLGAHACWYRIVGEAISLKSEAN